jgi:translation initiation factor 6
MSSWKADWHGSPHIGIFCIVTDEVAVIPPSTTRKFEELLKEKLLVDVVRTTLVNSSLLGIFAAAGAGRIFVPDITEREERRVLRDVFPEVVVLEERCTALGNLMALNGNGIASSRHLGIGEHVRVAGSDFVGSAVFATSKGFLAHRDASAAELKELERILKVRGGTGTVNMGDPFVRSGLVGNRNGVIAGTATSGPEMLRIDDIFMS